KVDVVRTCRGPQRNVHPGSALSPRDPERGNSLTGWASKSKVHYPSFMVRPESYQSVIFSGKVYVFNSATSAMSHTHPLCFDQGSVNIVVSIMSMTFRFERTKEAFHFSFLLRASVSLNPIKDSLDFLLILIRVKAKVGLFSGCILVARVIEERHHLVVFFMTERIVGMAVTLYASKGGTLPNLHCCVYPIDHAGNTELLVDGPALIIVHRVAVEACRDELVVRRSRQ